MICEGGNVLVDFAEYLCNDVKLGRLHLFYGAVLRADYNIYEENSTSGKNFMAYRKLKFYT